MTTVSQHYALHLITLDDVLTFFDRLVEVVGERRLRECLAGKYAPSFTNNAIITCKLLSGLSQVQEEQEEEEKEKPVHETLDPDRLLEIIRTLPVNLDLDLFGNLVTYIPEDKSDMENLLEWVGALDLGTIEATDEVSAIKEIAKSDFTLADIAKAIKQDPDGLMQIVNGEGEELSGNSSIAELVEIMA